MAKFCSSCGGSVESGQKYCMHCGAPVVEASFVNDAQNGAQGAVPQPQAQVITNGSPLSRAWNELKAEKGLIGKALILTIITCIPIANFLSTGYLLKYGVDAALGGKDGLPEKIASKANFMLGFFTAVISLVWGLVIGILSSIPVIGVLAGLAVLVLAPCLILCQMRLGLFGSLGSAFELTKVWDLFRPNIGTTLVIFWAPAAVVLVISFVAGIVGALFGGFGAILGSLGDVTALFAAGTVSIVALLIVLVIAFVSIFANLVIYRAFGYFVAETAPQWVRDGMVANPQVHI